MGDFRTQREKIKQGRENIYEDRGRVRLSLDGQSVTLIALISNHACLVSFLQKFKKKVKERDDC